MATAFEATGRRVLGEITSNKETKLSTKKASKPIITQKEIAEKIKYSNKTEISLVLKKIFNQHRSLRSFLQYHRSSNAATLSAARGSSCLSSMFPMPDARRALPVLWCPHLPQLWKASVQSRAHHEYFHLTKSEADKIRRTMGASAYSGYTYQPCDVIKAVNKKHGSLLKFCVQSKHMEWEVPSTQDTDELLAAADTEAERKKLIADAIRYSDKRELDSLLKDITREHLAQVEEIVAAFHPDKMPAKPSASDPLLKQCFLCKDSNTSLHKFHDIMGWLHESTRWLSVRDQVINIFSTLASMRRTRSSIRKATITNPFLSTTPRQWSQRQRKNGGLCTT